MLKEMPPTANPLAVYGKRELKYCPPHFLRMEFALNVYQPKIIFDWIHENTESRFYFNPTDIKKVVIAFENHGELSYFALMLPTFNVTPTY